MALEKLERCFQQKQTRMLLAEMQFRKKERMTTKQLSQELESLKIRIKELEAIESRLKRQNSPKRGFN